MPVLVWHFRQQTQFVTGTGVTLYNFRASRSAGGEPLEPPPVCPACGPPTNWGELIQSHDDRNVFQVSPDQLALIDIHSL